MSAASGVRISMSSPWQRLRRAIGDRRATAAEVPRLEDLDAELAVARPEFALKFDPATQTAPFGISSAVLW